MEYCEPDKCMSVAAIKQLWSWVGERKDTCEREAGTDLLRGYHEQCVEQAFAMKLTQDVMRTLFAGLIDFGK